MALLITPAGGSIPNTDSLTEGSTNLYFTNTRARGAVSVTSATASGNGSLSYNNSTGVFTFTPASIPSVPGSTDSLTEGSTNLYFTNARARGAVSVTSATASGGGSLSYVSGTGVFTFTPASIPSVPGSTDSLTEGSTNLYFTNARARSAISLTGSGILSYNSSTGVISQSNVMRRIQEFTATSGQTVFTITGGYVAGNIDVYRNGVQLAAADITATNGTSVTLASAAVINDLIRVISYDSNYVPPSITASAPLTYNGVTGALTFDGSSYVSTGKSIAMAIVFG